MSGKLRHLLLATLEDPSDPQSWSGTPLHMRMALEAKVEKLSVLAHLRPKRTLVTVALRALLGGRPPRYPLYLTAPAQREFARRTEEAIDAYKPNAMLTISSHSMVRMGRPRVPAFMVTDAPWLAWKETYREFDRMPLLGPRFGRLEAAASERYTGLIFSSDWAVAEAERLYAAPRDKLHSIPLGAIWTPAMSAHELHGIIDARPSDRLDLLFVGKDWERKGGPQALKIARELRVAGTPGVTLHIVGCSPEIPPDDREFVQLHGFLDMRVAEESKRLEGLFLTSHFLLVPTRAECFGVVFAEAQAFGLPPVSCAVQALPSIVLDGVTGILEPPDAPAAAYARRLTALIGDKERYRTMARAARARFECQLTWDRFASRVVETIERALP